MWNNTRNWVTFASLCALMTLGSGTASAAFIGFTEFTTGANVSVGIDANDWRTFSSTSTSETAHADATLFKFASQGSTPGTYGFFVTEGGVVSDVIVAVVTNLNANLYQVVYDFFSDPNLPDLNAINFTATFTQEERTAGNSFGLPSYSQEIFINSGTAEIPEPTTVVLLALGLAGVGFSRRKKA